MIKITRKRVASLFVIITVIIALLFYGRMQPRYEHEFAVCAMFKNEAPYLKEWIDYHHYVLGATHFYLYNNDSTDNYKTVLKPYCKKGIVELIDWESCEENAIDGWSNCASWDRYQIGAYNDCLKNRALGKAHWVAVHDIDEYIVPVQKAKAFKKLLKRYNRISWRSIVKKIKDPFHEHKLIGSLRFHWLIFGTSNVWDIKPEEFLTEKLYLRARDDHPWHCHTKCIHRPEAIDMCLIHQAVLKEGYKSKTLKTSKFRIHHYWTGPEKRLLEKRPAVKEDLLSFSKEFNCIEDKSIFNKVKEMKSHILKQ